MINSHKLLILLIVLNFMLGLSTQFYQNADTFTSSTLTEVQAAQGDLQQFANETIASNKTSTYTEGQYDPSAVNKVKLGRTVTKMFFIGLLPFPVQQTDANSLTEKLIISIIKYFQGLLWIIIGLEIYFIFINKKTT